MPTLFATKKKKEKARALARLAAQETAALMNRCIELTSDRDKAAAYQRVAALVGFDLSEKAQQQAVISHVEQMVLRLRESDLNINFPAAKFFAGKPEDKYTTKYERMRNAGAPMGDTRNQAEHKMFRYSDHVGIDLSTATAGERAAALRIAELGDLQSEKFQGSIRPKYCSLNFPGLCDGFGAQWGKSHLVLADHLKPNMTFVHSDSFDVVGSDKVTPQIAQSKMASYHHMYRLILNMPDSTLALLSDAVTGHAQRGQTCEAVAKTYGFGSTAYIEGHLHGELYFARDLKKIRICYDELARYADGAEALKKKIYRFQDKYKVRMEFF